MGAQPGLAGSQFPSEDALVRRVQDLERTVQQLAAANQLATAGIQAVPNGIVVNGSETINGPLTVNDSMDVAGDAEFTGNMSITGTLNLPAGIIGNDALANPIEPLASHVDVTNFALSTGPNVELVRTTITVPAGFTTALVYATASMNAKNYNASKDSMYLACTINGSTPGWSGQQTVDADDVGHVTKAATGVLTGLGSSFYVNAKASSGGMNWAASTGNQNSLNLDVMVIFAR